jgi:hypothetical protein
MTSKRCELEARGSPETNCAAFGFRMPSRVASSRTQPPFSSEQGTIWTACLGHRLVAPRGFVYTNFFAWRLNNHGGNGPVHCEGTCETHDSWDHALVLQYNFHMNAEGSNGIGAGHSWLAEHNYLDCGDFAGQILPLTGGPGCSADFGLYGDFAPINNVTIKRNFFAPALDTGPYQPGFCLQSGMGTQKAFPTVTNEIVTENVFAKGITGFCGTYGLVSGWDTGNGNQWIGNMWDDATSANP